MFVCIYHPSRDIINGKINAQFLILDRILGAVPRLSHGGDGLVNEGYRLLLGKVAIPGNNAAQATKDHAAFGTCFKTNYLHIQAELLCALRGQYVADIGAETKRCLSIGGNEGDAQTVAIPNVSPKRRIDGNG